MKRNICLLFTLTILLISTTVFPCFAAASQEGPMLKSISFKNAQLSQPFSPNVFEYTLILEDSSKTPSLENYEIEGEAELFVSYSYDESNRQTGIMAELKFDTGSSLYNFNYDNYDKITPAVKNSNNNNLTDIYCSLGELSPSFDENETTYRLYIPKDLTELTITPVTEDTNAYCPPVELILSEEQKLNVTLTCVATDGSEKDYNVYIKRVDKTVEQVKSEMAMPGYTSFLEGTRFYQKPEFLMIIGAVAAGVILMAVLFKFTKKISANPYDKNEKPFYIENSIDRQDNED